MAKLYPFRALRPKPEYAAAIAAVPYDVVNTEEARAQAADNPRSFLRVSRAEIDLPEDTNPYSRHGLSSARSTTSAGYANRRWSSKPSRACISTGCGWARTSRLGLAACFSIDEYDRDVIKKHERTRRDKEDDRTRHMLALGAQTGPVFLTYRASADVIAMATRVTAGAPLFDFDAPRRRAAHAVARRPAPTATRSSQRSRRFRRSTSPTATTAPRARRGRARRSRGRRTRSATGRFTRSGGRVSRTTRCRSCRTTGSSRISAGCTPRQFMQRGARACSRRSRAGDAGAARRDRDVRRRARGTRCGRERRPTRRDPIASLDVSVLQDQCSAPVLSIADVRTDKRIDFVGGARGTAALEAAVDSGKAAVAFSLYPGERRRPDGRLRRRRDHAAQVHLVRAETARRAADHI